MVKSLIPASFWQFPSLKSFWEDEDWEITTTPSGLSISEDDQNVYVEAALPGLEPDDIEVSFDKGVLWIKGEAKEETTKKKYYRKATSSFSYRVVVPGDLDPNKEPTASYKNGLMRVTFAKSPASQPKKIKVKAEK
ncbi:MAG: Hsp20/alpha crystallin family protein [Nitrososphaerota archaeon]